MPVWGKYFLFQGEYHQAIKQTNYEFERFQDEGEARTRMHSGFGGMIAYEQNRALGVFNATQYISELPETFAYIFPEAEGRVNDELKQKMLLQEQIAQKILDEMNKAQRD